jgi:hypothetical protein
VTRVNTGDLGLALVAWPEAVALVLIEDEQRLALVLPEEGVQLEP